MGDRARSLTGRIGSGGANANGVQLGGSGVFYENTNGYYVSNSAGSGTRPIAVDMNSGRLVPTGAVDIPRSWGALACAYFGQPSAA